MRSFEPREWVMVYPELLEALDGDVTSAYVYQWIRYRCNSKHGKQSYELDGFTWWRAPRSALAEELRLTDAKVRRALGGLVDRGYLVTENHAMEGWTDRAASYRPSGALDQDMLQFSDWMSASNGGMSASNRLDASIQCSSISIKNNNLRLSASNALGLNNQSPEGLEIDDLFDEWYKIYPRKENPTPARRSFRTALRKLEGDPTLLFEGVRQYALEVAGKETRFIALATTWLNGCRWENLEHEEGNSSLHAVITSLIDSGEFKKLFALTGTSGPMLGPAEHDILEDLPVDDRKRQKEVWQRAWATENLDDLVRKAEKRKANSN